MQLTISNLSKTYSNGVKAINDINLTIGPGMFGLLGPNGAGKSSLMRTIATLQEPDQGQILFNGINGLENKQAIREQLGYLPQEFGVYPKISATDLLDHIAVLKGIANAGERKDLVKDLLSKVNLYDVRKKNVSEFSGGMKQRFGIAQALIGAPNLIIVDEPTAGLDPGERNRFHNLLSEIAENKIVILSTHIVQDVIELCNDMAVINKGNLLYKGSPDNAIATIKDKVWEKVVSKTELPALEQSYTVISNKLIAGKPFIHAYSETPLPDFARVTPTLEDAYFYFINVTSKN